MAKQGPHAGIDPDGEVLRHDALLWKRRPGATSTPDEFLAREGAVHRSPR
jgi:hypothetical protein